jgi:hypothetical protein
MSMRTLTALLLVLLVAPAAPAQAPDNTKLKETLFALEKEGWEIIKKKDAAALKAYLSDDFQAIFVDGARVTKADFLKMLPDFNLVDYQLEADTELVVPTKDVGILLYRMTFTLGIKDAKPEKHTVYAASSYVLRDGKWLNVYYQETALKK